ncbi:hypothetical protein GGS23DRAFT_595529 [Durotheca rogersii]|uniref:uncharacterized protein n=1 Tax=Durotheca rogersii TaxID=419775 RepID=UPI00221F1D6E|nr:uncharacterized protein GGS23DRAFT_595529 [Durotheca rogersii]KAI5864837.1 hypothetical protein GGS23DRAFT_595529 [Durotheca rogersii]
MAIQSELERPGSWALATDHYPPQRLRPISSISSPHLGLAPPRPAVQLPRLAAISEASALSHAGRVERLAGRLKKGTRRRYLEAIGAARLELLPQSVLDRICRHVPYERLLWLYQQSRALRRHVDPHLAPHETKLSFVLRAERDYPQHRLSAPPNLGCYMCHRVLPAALFASNQPLQALLRAPFPDPGPGPSPRPRPTPPQVVVNLRRFCIRCGIQSGCHLPGDSLITRTGYQFWLCRCFRILDDHVPHCKDCRAVCPFAPQPRTRRPPLGGGPDTMASGDR